VIDSATRELIRLLLERISSLELPVQVSEQWLQTHVNEKYAQVPRSVQVTPKKGGSRFNATSCGHLDHKGNKQWVYLMPTL